MGETWKWSTRFIALPTVAGCAMNPPLEQPYDAGDGVDADSDAGPRIVLKLDDAGQGRSDAGGAGDAGSGLLSVDAGRPDAGPAGIDCAGFARYGYASCSAAPAECTIIFYDASGCVAACGRLQLSCLDSWNNIESACAPDENQPAGCTFTGRTSEFCVCGAP